MNTSFDEKAFQAVAAGVEEPEWARHARLEAYEQYRHLPSPTRQDEAWRYFDFSRVPVQDVRPHVQNGHRAVPPSALGADHLGESGWAVTVHGRAGAIDIEAGLLSKGVIAMSLPAAMDAHPELVRRAAGLVSPSQNKLAAWHQAFCPGGLFLYIPKNLVVEKPIRVVSWGEDEGKAWFPRTAVVVEEGAQATLVEEYASPNMKSFGWSQGLLEIHVGPRAKATVVHVQGLGEGVASFLTAKHRVERDAELLAYYVALGGTMHRAEIIAEGAAEGAVSRVCGVVVGAGHQHMEHHTLQDHLAPHTTSDLLFKVVLKDRARSVFSGLIHVHKNAQKSDAYQKNRNLLLSNESKADSLPKLEIEADDVRCTHGATVGTLDEDQRYYLMTRGLSRSDAEHVMVEGFFSEILDRLPDVPLRDRLGRLLTDKVYGA